MEDKTYYEVIPEINHKYRIIESKYNISNYLTKEEAIEDYEKAYEIALDKYNKIMYAISKIKKEIYEFEFDYYTDDDNIFNSRFVLNISVNGYDFKFLILSSNAFEN